MRRRNVFVGDAKRFALTSVQVNLPCLRPVVNLGEVFLEFNTIILAFNFSEQFAIVSKHPSR